jgi:hypothetical protein
MRIVQFSLIGVVTGVMFGVPSVGKTDTLSFDFVFDEYSWRIGGHKHAESWHWFEEEVGTSHGDMFDGKCGLAGSSVE